jgi:hypothetical protein
MTSPITAAVAAAAIGQGDHPAWIGPSWKVKRGKRWAGLGVSSADRERQRCRRHAAARLFAGLLVCAAVAVLVGREGAVREVRQALYLGHRWTLPLPLLYVLLAPLAMDAVVVVADSKRAVWPVLHAAYGGVHDR